MDGKIIVLEGIDGSGKNTQAGLLQYNLSSRGIDAELLHFPLYSETFFGNEVANYLNGVFGDLKSVHPKLGAMLYAGDRFEKKDFLWHQLQAGKVVILDRYVPSNIAYQGAKLPPNKREEFRRWVEKLEYGIYGLPRPDVIFFLDLLPEIAFSLVLEKEDRSYTDKKRDLHEENIDYLKDVYNVFKELNKENDNWITVKCYEDASPKNIEQVQEELCSKVNSFL